MMAVVTVKKSLVVDEYGRSVYIAEPKSQATYTQSYQAATQGRRYPAITGRSSGSSAVLASAEVLRNRSHHALRNNPWAWGSIESLVANWIGTGITPDSQLPEAERRLFVHELWDEWIKESDAAGVTNFYGQQWQSGYGLAESGEVFIRYRLRRPSDGLSVPLQLQVLEPDHVPIWKTGRAENGNIIKAGIEFDALGRRAAYHMLRQHPGDSFFVGDNTSTLQTVRVPASQVSHVFIARRPGQIRGEPWLARVLLRLNDLDEFDDAEIMRKKTAALFSAFIRTDSELQSTEILSGQEATEAEEVVDDLVLEPATIKYLGPGQDIAFAEPADVGSNFGAFVEHELRGLAMGSGTTYEQFTGDLSGVNFSAIRAGLIEFRRRAAVYIHSWICHQVCQATWRHFIREAILSGALPYLSDFARSPRPFYKVRWIADEWDFVNPNQETDAVIKKIRAGITSRSAEVSKRRRMPEELDNEISEDNKRAAAKGLVFTSNAAHGVKA